MKHNPNAALVVLSGGQDSTTCLFWALHQGWDVSAVTYDYGQRHQRELRAARKVVALAEEQFEKTIPHGTVKVGPILQGTSPLTDHDEVLEQYPDGDLPGGLEKTFVPMRNQLFLTLAANHAYVRGINRLVTGVCQEDSGGYPDCRQSFVTAVEQACNTGTFTGEPGTLPPLRIHTPLMWLSKAHSVHLACQLPGCIDALAFSHTAYDGQFPPVGNDHATVLRAKGFEEAGVADPLVLRAVRMGLMDLPRTANYDKYHEGGIE